MKDWWTGIANDNWGILQRADDDCVSSPNPARAKFTFNFQPVAAIIASDDDELAVQTHISEYWRTAVRRVVYVQIVGGDLCQRRRIVVRREAQITGREHAVLINPADGAIFQRDFIPDRAAAVDG